MPGDKGAFRLHGSSLFLHAIGDTKKQRQSAIHISIFKHHECKVVDSREAQKCQYGLHAYVDLMM